MDPQVRESTRLSLHGVAEFVLAGPQFRLSKDIRLQVTPGGFGTVTAPALRVDGVHLVSDTGRFPLAGTTCAQLAIAAGLEASALRDVYADGPGIGIDDRLHVDEGAAREIAGSFSDGDTAMRAFAPGEEPVLWPEHFDVGIAAAEVNFGVSPGDAHLAEPYAYVGPWTPLEGDFWNTPFGAARAMSELPDSDAVLAFFREGADLAAH